MGLIEDAGLLALKDGNIFRYFRMEGGSISGAGVTTGFDLLNCRYHKNSGNLFCIEGSILKSYEYQGGQSNINFLSQLADPVNQIIEDHWLKYSMEHQIIDDGITAYRVETGGQMPVPQAVVQDADFRFNRPEKKLWSPHAGFYIAQFGSDKIICWRYRPDFVLWETVATYTLSTLSGSSRLTAMAAAHNGKFVYFIHQTDMLLTWYIASDTGLAHGGALALGFSPDFIYVDDGRKILHCGQKYFQINPDDGALTDVTEREKEFYGSDSGNARFMAISEAEKKFEFFPEYEGADTHRFCIESECGSLSSKPGGLIVDVTYTGPVGEILYLMRSSLSDFSLWVFNVSGGSPPEQLAISDFEFGNNPSIISDSDGLVYISGLNKIYVFGPDSFSGLSAPTPSKHTLKQFIVKYAGKYLIVEERHGNQIVDYHNLLGRTILIPESIQDPQPHSRP